MHSKTETIWQTTTKVALLRKEADDGSSYVQVVPGFCDENTLAELGMAIIDCLRGSEELQQVIEYARAIPLPTDDRDSSTGTLDNLLPVLPRPKDDPTEL